MLVSVHRRFVHGSNVIGFLLVPIKQLSEEAKTKTCSETMRMRCLENFKN